MLQQPQCPVEAPVIDGHTNRVGRMLRAARLCVTICVAQPAAPLAKRDMSEHINRILMRIEHLHGRLAEAKR